MKFYDCVRRECVLYSLVRYLIAAIFLLLFRWKITGAHHLPKHGGVIVASNHISNFDPLIIGTAIPRRIHFMAKEELFQNPILRTIIQWLGAFPVKRGAADRTAIRTAMDLLNNGKVVGLFPEGTRSRTGELSSAEPGLAMIAARTGSVVVPAAIIGANNVLRNGSLLPQFRVIFGEPIAVEKGKASKEELEKLTGKIMQEIQIILKKYS